MSKFKRAFSLATTQTKVLIVCVQLRGTILTEKDLHEFLSS
jgi:hypothetical protein